MLSFELKKKTSNRLKKQIRRVLEIQEERMQVAERQVEIAMKDEKFAKIIETWRSKPKSIEEKNRAWRNVLNSLPAHLLDFQSMLRDASYYYNAKNADVMSGLVSEIVRETYDMMIRHLYDQQSFKLEDYNIRSVEKGLLVQSDGFHHFYCKMIFNELTMTFQWCKFKEDIELDQESYEALVDSFFRYEFGYWFLCENEGIMHIEYHSRGSKYMNLRVRRCAYKLEPLKIKQPNGQKAFRIIAQIIINTPSISQTAVKDKAVEEDLFRYHNPKRTETTAIAVFKRLKTLHPDIIALIPDLCDMDLALLNTIARMRMDYLFYVYMNTTYLEIAILQMVEFLSNAMKFEPSMGRHINEGPSTYENSIDNFLKNRKAYKLPEDPWPIKKEFTEFLIEAKLVKVNAFGGLEITPLEMSPELLQILLDFGYGAYVRVLMGRYKFQPIYTEDAVNNFIDRLWKDLMKLDDLDD